ncbi:MAG: hypothetical protein IJC45_07245 [Clostridia bacterium]|nr:hypothetical protein [Clostridia bacterium]
MENVFLQLLNMSITASWIVLAVLILRLFLRKAPKAVSCALWALVGVRLVFPFSVESVFSLIPSRETVPQDILLSPTPNVHTGIPAFNSVVNPVIEQAFAPYPGSSANPLQIVTAVACIVWAVGVVGLWLYAAISYFRLHRLTRESIATEKNVFVCDRIDTPFILGVLKPRIFLPSSMEQADVSHVLAHERAHLQRHDHWWKPLGFLLVSVYWFNPVLWVAYVFLCRDIELACDEKVIRICGEQIKKDYSTALINCSVSRKSLAACPLAFGEVGVKGRIKAVLHYKKATVWVLIAAVLLSCVAAVCLLTDPVQDGMAGATYRISRYYYDNVIGADRANRESGEVTVDINDALFATRKLNGNYHSSFYLYELEDEDFIDRVRSYLPLYTSLFGVKEAYISVTGELDYFFILLTNGDLYGGYVGVHDDLPGEVYKYQKIDEYHPATVMQSQRPPRPQMQTEVPTSELLSGEDAQNGVSENKLTLTDVIERSEKGSALSWEDFEDFDYVETGSGLYIRMYEIDDLFSLSIGGGSLQDEPMYIYLSANDGMRTVIDIRESDVRTYITEHVGNPPAENVQTNGIYACRVGYTDGAFAKFMQFSGIPKYIAVSSIRYLPVYRVDTLNELRDFMNGMQDVFDFTRATETEPAFADVAVRFDGAFFDENRLLLAYVESGSISRRYQANAVEKCDGMLTLEIAEDGAQTENAAMDGWLIAVGIPRSELTDVSDVQSFVTALMREGPTVSADEADVQEMTTVARIAETGVQEEVLLYEDAEWTVSSMAGIGDEKYRMLDLTVDSTQKDAPLVRIGNETELNRFMQYVGPAMTLVVENLNVNAYGQKRFDAGFFEENDLLLLYLENGTAGEMYAYDGAKQEDGSLVVLMNKVQFATHSVETQNEPMTAQLLTLAVPKATMDAVTDVRCEIF